MPRINANVFTHCLLTLSNHVQTKLPLTYLTLFKLSLGAVGALSQMGTEVRYYNLILFHLTFYLSI